MHIWSSGHSILQNKEFITLVISQSSGCLKLCAEWFQVVVPEIMLLGVNRKKLACSMLSQ